MPYDLLVNRCLRVQPIRPAGRAIRCLHSAPQLALHGSQPDPQAARFFASNIFHTARLAPGDSSASIVGFRITTMLFALMLAGCNADEPPVSVQETNSSESSTADSGHETAAKMREHVDRIEKWLQSNAPELVTLLSRPATPDDLSAFESRNKVLLSPEVRQLYLIHNGESQDSDGLFGCWKLLSLQQIQEEIELTGHEGRVPLFLSGGGDSYYVKSFDATNPDIKVYECWHEQPDKETVIADSLSQFLSDFCDKLQDGQYVRDPDAENPLKALVDRDDL